MPSHESPLAGGNISQVVRVGDTVHRHQGSWSTTVHGLLDHLAAQGFTGAPRFLGIDDQDREILSYLPGDVGSYPLQPYMWFDDALVRAGRLLRQLHDASVGYAPDDAVWQMAYPDATLHEVICHNDIAPYNTVFVDERRVAFFDFDTASPGPRWWDLAYAAYTFVPLAGFVPFLDGTTRPYESSAHAVERARRLQLLAETYGPHGSPNLVQSVVERLEAMCTLLADRAATGDATYMRLVDEGHLQHYEREIAFIQRHGDDWEVERA